MKPLECIRILFVVIALGMGAATAATPGPTSPKNPVIAKFWPST